MSDITQMNSRTYPLGGYAGMQVHPTPPPIDWKHVRIDAAISAMQGLLSNPEESGRTTIATEAVWHADKLIAELKKEVQG